MELQPHTPLEAPGSKPDPPPLAALFLIKFDLKVGYTIAWKRSIPEAPLESIVEFKSLPSGLHNVDEDLVYFSHQSFAGISAFQKAKASVSERNASFVAVGALVRLQDGRLGRAWEHAAQLRTLAQKIIVHPSHTDILLTYWDEFGIKAETTEDYISPQLSPFSMAQRKARSLSTATLNLDEKRTLPVEHPAMAILDYLDAFGPLIFPLHRASLLRKRILLVSSAPIRKICEFSKKSPMFMEEEEGLIE